MANWNWDGEKESRPQARYLGGKRKRRGGWRRWIVSVIVGLLNVILTLGLSEGLRRLGIAITPGLVMVSGFFLALALTCGLVIGGLWMLVKGRAVNAGATVHPHPPIPSPWKGEGGKGNVRPSGIPTPVEVVYAAEDEEGWNGLEEWLK